MTSHAPVGGALTPARQRGLAVSRPAGRGALSDHQIQRFYICIFKFHAVNRRRAPVQEMLCFRKEPNDGGEDKDEKV